MRVVSSPILLRLDYLIHSFHNYADDTSTETGVTATEANGTMVVEPLNYGINFGPKCSWLVKLSIVIKHVVS